MYNDTLLQLAKWRIDQQRQTEKVAFVPSGATGDGAGGDPSAGGMAGAMAGGGAPPDPSMMGAMAGGDPSAGAGAPPPPPPDPSAGAMGGGMDISEMVRTAVQTELAKVNAGGMGGDPSAAGGMNKPIKADINTVAMDIFQVKKMITFLFNYMKIPLPPDVMDGPNRDPATGQPTPPNAPGSTSDPTRQSAPPDAAIKPIEPMQPAMPPDSGAGGVKQSFVNSALFDMGEESTSFTSIKNKAAGLANLAKSLRERQPN